jgi:hypothetical protein
MLHEGAKQHNEMLALALEPSILVNSIGMSWQHVCLPLKSHVIVVGVDDQAVACCRYRVMLVTVLLSHAGDVAVESYW